MKSKYKLSGLGIIIIIIMLIFLNPCIYRAKAADTVRLKNGAMEISSKRLSAQISFGYKGNTKYGKRMKVCAVINNKRIFFSGKFRITYKTGKNGGLKMIQKDYAIDLAPGTYYMLIDGEKSLGSSTKSTGNYSFTMKLEKANVTYTQSDDDFASAYKLSLNKDITGHIAINDKEDIMTFTLSKDTFMTVREQSW